MSPVVTGLVKRYVPLTAMSGAGLVSLALVSVLAFRVDGAKREFSNFQNQLSHYRSEIWHLEKINRSDLNQELAKERLRFPSAGNLAVLIGELTDIAKRHGVTVVSMNPKTTTAPMEKDKEVLSVLDRLSLDMSLAGTYEGLAMFLSEFDHLEHGILRVDQFSLARKEPSKPELSLTLTADLFVKKDSQQDIFETGTGSQVPRERNAHKSRFPEIGRNPFVGKEERPVSTIAIEGIIYDPAAPMVLVGGDVKSAGDRVNDAVIVEIFPDSVLFKKEDGEEIRVHLQQT